MLQPKTKVKQKTRIISLLLFLIVFLVYILSPVVQSSDSRLVVYVSTSILRQANIDLDEYPDWVKNYYAALQVGDHFYNKYPIGTSLLALPLVGLFDIFTAGSFSKSLNQSWPIAQELIIASFIAALSAVVIFHIARLTLPLLPSLLITFLYAFCTSAWSTFSRALWQHGSSVLMLALTLYFLLWAKKRQSVVQYAGLFIALSYIMRPTNALSIVILTVYVFISHRQYFMRYLLWASCIAIPFITFNLLVFHSILPRYYVQQDILLNQYPLGLIEHLIGPAQGLFIYTPVVFLAFWGIGIKIRQKELNSLDVAIGLIIFIHWLIIPLFAGWWPGTAFYGSRFFSDMTAYFIYFTISLVAWLMNQRRLILWTIFTLILGFGFYINWYGATKQETVKSYPANIDAHQWDWSDVLYLN